MVTATIDSLCGQAAAGNSIISVATSLMRGARRTLDSAKVYASAFSGLRAGRVNPRS